MKGKKAQAAMEFLMTYGWAILVVLVVIGALAYFGVLSPGRLLPDRCQLPPGVSCDDFSISGTTLTIILTNGLGQETNFTSFMANSPDGGAVCTGSTPPSSDGLPSVGPGVITPNSGRATLAATCTGLVSAGNKQRLMLNLTYTLGTTGLLHTLQGDLYTTIG